MNIPVNSAAQTFRLVDEHHDETVGGALSLLMPGSRGGHLLLSIDPPPAGSQGRRLALATSPGPTERWRVLAREKPAPATQTFQLAFVASPDRVLVLYEKATAPRDE